MINKYLYNYFSMIIRGEIMQYAASTWK